jgi:hypothetical protein
MKKGTLSADGITCVIKTESTTTTENTSEITDETSNTIVSFNNNSLLNFIYFLAVVGAKATKTLLLF